MAVQTRIMHLKEQVQQLQDQKGMASVKVRCLPSLKSFVVARTCPDDGDLTRVPMDSSNTTYPPKESSSSRTPPGQNRPGKSNQLTQ